MVGAIVGGGMAVTPVGIHCLCELYDCPSDLLNDAVFVKSALRQAAKESGSSLLQVLSHKFVPQGVTGLGLLAESHLSIHTWPEHNFVAVDIFTCGQKLKPEAACKYLAKVFCAGRYSIMTMSRGGVPPGFQVTSVMQEESMPSHALKRASVR
ncbi:MAG: adenosylmethionine decarboxylase [Pseudomonadota bacterium]